MEQTSFFWQFLKLYFDILNIDSDHVSEDCQKIWDFPVSPDFEACNFQLQDMSETSNNFGRGFFKDFNYLHMPRYILLDRQTFYELWTYK